MTKINGNIEIGETGKTLNEVATTSFAKMTTSSSSTYLTSYTKITEWTSNKTFTFSVGDFVAQPANARIKIPAGSAKFIKLSGCIGGNGYCECEVEIIDVNGNRNSGYNVQQLGTLFQFAGNGYWKASLPSTIIKIDDTTKDWYLNFSAGPYVTENFYLNQGFGASTYIQVEKIS